MRYAPAFPVAVLCTLVATMPAEAEPPRNVDGLIACMMSDDFAASDDCAKALATLSEEDVAVRADIRVHRAFNARIRRDLADFQGWQAWVATKSEADLESEPPEYEDGASTAWLAQWTEGFLPTADADSRQVLFDALLVAAAMLSDIEQTVANHGEPALPATVRFLRDDSIDRRDVVYGVLGRMLEAHAHGTFPAGLSAAARQSAETTILGGLQDAEPHVRLKAIRAAQRGRVRGALPMLRVLASTLPADDRFRLRLAAAEAVASLTR